MPKPTKGKRLGKSPAHEKLMIANLARDLFVYREVRTTVAKARRLQPLAEKLITKAKRGDIHARRTVAKVIPDKDVLYALFDGIVGDLDPQRQGGYTRIVNVAPRRGDNAPMCIISIVDDKLEKKAVVSDAEKTAARAAAASGATAAAATEADSEVEGESASSASAESSASSPSAESAKSAE